MLDELGSSMSHTDSRMNNVMKKLTKLTKLENGESYNNAKGFVTFLYE